MSIYNDAVDNWPEDEASMSASMALEIFADDGHDYYHQWLIKERNHFMKIFNDEELMKRFCAKFNALTLNITNLSI
jgi:hypothetical protein